MENKELNVLLNKIDEIFPHKACDGATITVGVLKDILRMIVSPPQHRVPYDSTALLNDVKKSRPKMPNTVEEYLSDDAARNREYQHPR